MNKEFIPPREASKILGVHAQTLYRYEECGLIETIRTPGGKRLYNVKDYLLKQSSVIDEKLNICYCRVSTNGQKSDLERQIKYMKERYPSYKIISDIGSGINFKRKGLREIIVLAKNNKINKVVIAYKDRLCRIGYEMIEYIINSFSDGEIIIENQINSSPEEEIVKDLLQIITVFSARVNGLRSYSHMLKNDDKIKQNKKT